jgi:hypothetical protein
MYSEMIRPTFLGVGGCVGYRLFWREETRTKILASIIDMVDIQRKIVCLHSLRVGWRNICEFS